MLEVRRPGAGPEPKRGLTARTFQQRLCHRNQSETPAARSRATASRPSPHVSDTGPTPRANTTATLRGRRPTFEYPHASARTARPTSPVLGQLVERGDGPRPSSVAALRTSPAPGGVVGSRAVFRVSTRRLGGGRGFESDRGLRSETRKHSLGGAGAAASAATPPPEPHVHVSPWTVAACRSVAEGYVL
jgi:hypothetical protein